MDRWGYPFMHDEKIADADAAYAHIKKWQRLSATEELGGGES